MSGRALTSISGEKAVISIVDHCDANELYSHLKRRWKWHGFIEHEFPLIPVANQEGCQEFWKAGPWKWENLHLLTRGEIR